MITLPHTCSANKLPEVVWYCWRWAQSNIFPRISVGPTSVCQTCSFCMVLLFHLQRHHFHTSISPDKWTPRSLASTSRFLTGRGVRFISVAKTGTLLSGKKLKNPLLTLVITDYFLQIKCYLTSFSFVLILINVFIIFLLNIEEKLAVSPFIATANPH